MPDTDDLYEILQVHHAAEPEVVEAAYWRLARKYHPDVNKSDQAEGMMKALNLAYEVLGDPIKQAAYDRERGGQRQGAAGESPGRARASNEPRHDYLSQLSYWQQTLVLFAAAFAGVTETVQALISRGVDVNTHLFVDGVRIDIRDNNGYTLRHSVAEADVLSPLRHLANVGVNQGATPLHFAVKADKLRVAQMLAAYGADTDAKDEDGFTPLHTAAQSGNLRIVQMLASHGANISARSNGGYRPLHVAAYGGSAEVVRELIRLGADVNSRYRGHNTALNIALAEGTTARSLCYWLRELKPGIKYINECCRTYVGPGLTYDE